MPDEPAAMLLPSALVSKHWTVRFYEGEAKLLHRLVQEWCIWKANEVARKRALGRHLSAEEHQMDTRKARELAERVLQDS